MYLLLYKIQSIHSMNIQENVIKKKYALNINNMLDEAKNKSTNNNILIIHILSFSILSIIYTRTFQSSGYDQTARNLIHNVIKLHISWDQVNLNHCMSVG